jgi:hypothetical protein
MQADSSRQLHLIDAIILIAASAVALAISTQVDVQPTSIVAGQPAFSPFGSLAMGATLWVEKWISPWLISWAGAFLVICYWRPRPGLRPIWDQPGVLASALGILALIFVGIIALGRPALFILMLLLGSGPGPNSNPSMGLADILGETTSYGGALILGSWLTLAFSGRFRREPGWIGRLGMFIGSCWIGAHLISWISYRVLPF